ncbi:YkgJ family cysteine cluster protein [Magnetospira sp. QH-2]|uniref:YkgJ family cysteine cluster protein n=1 Tax=Magnetospira sp. (strain QH-2) TaxID=1288970 RepID=UPI0003E80AE0|nr:YkgJ family cysteine cluster protein [Magnetospira sp. QH-2]CCQ72677.1 conserved protein of unknown function [Magnetospira sp. QH-2]
MMSLGDTALQASELCAQCGLCCTGFLFSHADVTAEEVETFSDSGLSFYMRSPGKNAFRQPCACYRQGQCTTYESRPAVCVEYYCSLQKKIMNGSIALEDGRRIVGTVKRQADWLLRNADAPTDEKRKGLCLRDFLYVFHGKLEQERKNRDLTEAEKDYALKAFECIKYVDRFFAKTSRLVMYARLVQAIRAEPRNREL